MNKAGIVLAVVLALLVAPSLFAQQQILSFDAGANLWLVGVQPGTTNELNLTDFPDEYTEGLGCMQVDAKIRNFAASWGTWTDAQWTFPTPLDISQYEDIRFDMKIVTKPSHSGATISANRNIQFVIDLYDSVYYQGAPNIVLWRYTAGTGDMNIFYYPHDKWLSPSLTGWFEVIIPIQALRFPGWWGEKADGIFHGNNILRLGFGADGDSSAADSVTFLIDNMRATKKERVVQAQSMDGTASAWQVGMAAGDDITAIVSDYPDDYIEGVGSLEADVAIRSQAASWGTWTDISYNYPVPLDATGATELRFYYKTLTPTATTKNIQFVIDLFDSRGGPWRWANGAGQFGLWAAGLENNAQNTWTEVAIPIQDLTVPSWAAADTYIHLDSLMSLHFGVDADATGPDSVKFLLDDFFFTKQAPPSSVGPTPAGVAEHFRLEQNYPNPFNPSTTISYSLTGSGKVYLKVYNLMGQLVQNVLEGVEQTRGRYEVKVDMKDRASGVYIYVLQQGSQRVSKPMTLLK